VSTQTFTLDGSGSGQPLAERILDIRNLEVSFRSSSRAVYAVRGMSYDVRRADAVGLVGESGSGKSVSVLALLGLLPKRTTRVRGEAMFNGRNLLRLSSRELREVRGAEIGIVFQDPLSSLNPVLTVRRQIVETLAIHKGIRGRQARQQALDLLDLVGIPDPRRRLDRYPHEFSGGMRQRVLIAAALACEPALLIADEPTTALDVTVQAQILALLDRLRNELGMAIMLITHDLGVVAGLVDRLNVMYAGRIVEAGDVVTLLRTPQHPYTAGLLASIPRLESHRDRPLVPIGGAPPDLSYESVGCPFAPRCPHAFDRCEVDRPPLLRVDDTQRSACWLVANDSS
jgi:oligopeptide/dipeptide ABC transporter ATP-binding protein